MKIVYFIDHLRPDGTQKVLKQLVDGLARRGHEQTVICLNDSWDEVLVTDLHETQAKVRIVGKMALASGCGLLSIWRWLRSNRFDVAVTFLFVSHVIGRPLARAAGVPRIVSSLRTRNMHYAQWQRRLVRYTMRWADAVVLNSNYVRHFAVTEEGAPANRIYVIPNGVRVENYSQAMSRVDLCAEFGLVLDQRLVGSVGRLTHQKGFDVLLQAIALIPRPDINLVVIGTGEEEARLRIQAATLGLTRRVHFAGYRRDVPRLLGALDLYVHPARFEGMPNALLEAMAAGCPVVATAVDGNCELIEDGLQGRLVPAENVEALATAIQAALNNPVDARKQAVAAQTRVAKQFSVDAMVTSWEKVLKG